jgi:hypothetical protein
MEDTCPRPDAKPKVRAIGVVLCQHANAGKGLWSAAEGKDACAHVTKDTFSRELKSEGLG